MAQTSYTGGREQSLSMECSPQAWRGRERPELSLKGRLTGEGGSTPGMENDRHNSPDVGGVVAFWRMRERERYTKLNAEFQRTARRDKKA